MRHFTFFSFEFEFGSFAAAPKLLKDLNVLGFACGCPRPGVLYSLRERMSLNAGYSGLPESSLKSAKLSLRSGQVRRKRGNRQLFFDQPLNGFYVKFLVRRGKRDRVAGMSGSSVRPMRCT